MNVQRDDYPAVATQLTLFGPPLDPTGSIVYTMWKAGLIKIGTTARPITVRAKELEARPLAWTRGDAVMERQLHRHFKAEHIYRELFLPSPRMWAWIESLPHKHHGWPPRF